MNGMNRMSHEQGMDVMATPTSSSMSHSMMSHMTFFWGKNAEIIFSGRPGTSSGMYLLALIFVFVLCILIEWLSHCKLIKSSFNHVAAGLIQTSLYALRIALACLVMLALMSFNEGVFLIAVAVDALGFLLFGS
ncbi:hypothetical protein Patl1_31337 [Pistacia atlantica]|uniref:Uncharacterized protein n=1 Tax=Pistacia atlantica TaxID=434234 RepID=A0ACC1ADD0_9ROSI|nr:hypothetical protein Patl1_31337 [Pistacia atlantica]